MAKSETPCKSLDVKVDEQRKLVTARVPWSAVAGMSDEEAGKWLKDLLACRHEWERKGYTFRY